MTKDEKIALYEDMLGLTEDNTRYAALREAYRMSPGATWLLSRLLAAKGVFLPKQTLLDAIPGRDGAAERSLSAVKVRVCEIRGRFGKQHIEYDTVLGYRLSKPALDALRRKLNPEASVVEVIVQHADIEGVLKDPRLAPLDMMRIHGAWRASGG